MTQRQTLVVVLAFAVVGLIFSGVFSYRELFTVTTLSCPTVGAPGSIFGYPACVYGFYLYLVLTVVAAAGLVAKKKA